MASDDGPPTLNPLNVSENQDFSGWADHTWYTARKAVIVIITSLTTFACDFPYRMLFAPDKSSLC